MVYWGTKVLLQGIGAAVAIALAKGGANVVVNYVSPSSQTRAEQVQKTVESYGVQSLLVQADLGSLADIDILVEKTVAKFGKIDILVNKYVLNTEYPLINLLG